MDSLRHVPIPLAFYNFSITACENFHNYISFFVLASLPPLPNYKRTHNASKK